MLRSFARPRVPLPRPSAWRYQSCGRRSDPLRILFCGSDQFSIASLDALNKERQSNPELIESINVVCRPGKRTGPGLKVIKDVPIHHRALKLGLPLTHLDTFTGWTPPPTAQGHAINLIIAVSFGLLVPPRLLNAAKYGGLNIHPSLLPQFRGPAPVHHTLLARHEYTGVTLQTLHPRKMDHGVILAQTPQPGIRVVPPDEIVNRKTLQSTTHELADAGAAMLIDGLRQGLFVPPVRDLAPELSTVAPESITHAPKITPDMRRIDWRSMTADDIELYDYVIGPLWSEVREADSDTVHRVKWDDDSWPLDDGAFSIQSESTLRRFLPDEYRNTLFLDCKPGLAYLQNGTDMPGDLFVGTADGLFLATNSVQIAGLDKGLPPFSALLRAGIITQEAWDKRVKGMPFKLPNFFY